MCIDMTNDAGRQTFRQLAAQANVVVENLGPGTVDSWGCSFDDLLAHNARLVMLSISGYGRTGPLAGFRAYASNINNFVGLTSAWALDGIHFDFVAGTHGACAVVAALREVDHGADGVFIDLAQTETAAAILPSLYLDFLANGREWDAGPNEIPGSFFSGVMRCLGDDAWVAVELEDEEDWNQMCSLLERPELQLASGRPTFGLKASLHEATAAWAAMRTPMQATLVLQGSGLAAGPVHDGEDQWRDPQLRSRRSFVEVVHPDLGRLEYPDAPFPSGRPTGPRRSGPRLGEHTSDVLREWLGCSEARVRNLRATEAIWQPSPSSPDADGDEDAW